MGRLIPGVAICGPASHYRRLGARARRFRPAYSPHVTRYTALSLAHRRSTAAQAGRKACLLSSRGGARLCFLRSMPSLRRPPGLPSSPCGARLRCAQPAYALGVASARDSSVAASQLAPEGVAGLHRRAGVPPLRRGALWPIPLGMTVRTRNGGGLCSREQWPTAALSGSRGFDRDEMREKIAAKRTDDGSTPVSYGRTVVWQLTRRNEKRRDETRLRYGSAATRDSRGRGGREVHILLARSEAGGTLLRPQRAVARAGSLGVACGTSCMVTGDRRWP